MRQRAGTLAALVGSVGPGLWMLVLGIPEFALLWTGCTILGVPLAWWYLR